MSPVVHNKINPHERTRHGSVAESGVVICGKDGQEFVGVCDGPDKYGQCPFVQADGHLPCDGLWIVAGGWTLKVAPDAIACPVAMLGLTPAK